MLTPPPEDLVQGLCPLPPAVAGLPPIVNAAKADFCSSTKQHSTCVQRKPKANDRS